MDHVPGCRPTDHVSDSAEVQFAVNEATHVFYTNRFMTSVSRYVR